MVLLQNLQLSKLYENVYVKGAAHEDNRNTVLTIHDAETDELIITATVQIPESIILEAVIIKDYGENEGVFDWLVENKIIEPYTDLDHMSEDGIERGGTLVESSLIQDIQRHREVLEEKDMVTLGVSDDQGNIIYEKDGVTPMTFVFHKNEMKRIEQIAKENNLSAIEAIGEYLQEIGAL